MSDLTHVRGDGSAHMVDVAAKAVTRRSASAAGRGATEQSAVAALQEAGWLDVHPLAWIPRIEILGLYPTVEGVAVQLLTIAILVVGFSRHAAPKGARPAS